MYQLLSRLSIFHNLLLLSLAAVIGLLATSSLGLSSLRENLVEDRQLKTRHVVETAHGIVNYFYNKEVGGELSRTEAQQMAMDALRNMRYEGNEYFWINDMEPNMIMHPIKPELDGQNLSHIKDPSGKKLFVAFVDTVNKSGAGFVDYLWPKPGNELPVQKISYVKGVSGWGWVIGSGIYMELVELGIRRTGLGQIGQRLGPGQHGAFAGVKHRRLAPDAYQGDPLFAQSVLAGLLAVHVDAIGAAVDL